MTFDLNQPGSSTFFVNLSTIGKGDDNTQYCEATQRYTTPIIDRADDYVLSIERATIPLQGLKFFDDIFNAVSFVNKVNSNDIKIHNLQDIYNFQDFLQALNNFDDQQGNKIKVYVKTSGRLVLSYNKFDTYNIVLSDELKNMFDLNINTISSDSDTTLTIIGASSCINRIDYLKRIILVSRDLPSISEFNNRIKLREVTSIDYSPQTTFSATGGNNAPIDDNYTINLYPRDNLVLEPHYSRLINMSGSQITSINIQAYAETLNFRTMETELRQISLRPLSIFNVKIQFRRKKK